MSDTTYPEPLNKLTELGKPDTYAVGDWPDYVGKYSLSDEHVPDLIKMLEEHTQPVEDFDADDPLSWTAIHVWRALGQLKSETALRPMIDAMMRDVWEDWGWDDLTQAIALYGEAAIEPLTVELKQRASYDDKHPTFVQSTLEMIGKADPDLRERIGDIYIEQLKKAYTNTPDLNGFMIYTLADWKNEKALPVIEKAFENDDVDTFVSGDWDEIQVKYGLKKPEEVDKEAKNAIRRARMQRQFSSLFDEPVTTRVFLFIL